jgi:putative transposase
MRDAYTALELSALLGISARAVRIRATKESWPYNEVCARGGCSKHYTWRGLPDDIKLKINLRDRELALQVAAQDPVMMLTTPSFSMPEPPNGNGRNGKALTPYVPADPCSIPEAKATQALLTSRVVSLYRDALAARRARGESVAGIKRAFVLEFNQGAAGPWSELYGRLGAISVKSLERWDLKVRRAGNDPFTLTDRRGAHRRGDYAIAPAQERILEEVALVPNRLLDAEIIRVAKRRMCQEGHGCDLSDDTLRRWLDRFRKSDLARWVFYREGWKALNETCLFHVNRDYDRIDVGDILFADGHTTNFEILHPATGKPRRMTLVLWYEMKSNYPLGWDLMPSENTQSILTALYRAILALGKLPKVVYLDNGRAFRSKFFAGVPDFRQSPVVGLFERLGIKSIFAWPYHPETKPIEGFFRTFAELERRAPTYSGTSIDNKPARMKRNEVVHRKLHEMLTQGSAPTILETHRAIASWVDEYALRPQQGHLKGRCPLQVFSEGKGPGFTEEERFRLRVLMASYEIKRIPRDGIKVSWSDQRYYAPELFGRQGQGATIRYDWQDPSRVYVYGEDGAFICEAKPMARTHPAARHLGTDEDVEELARQVALKQSLAKQITGPAREFVERVVAPEVARQQEAGAFATGGDARGAAGEAGRLSLVERALTDEERERAEREFRELVALHERERAAEASNVIDVDFRCADEAPEVERRPTLWESVRLLPEMDRYEKDLEYEAQGMLIPREERDWMGYFERTAQYERFRDYFEDFRIKMALLHQ